jgi:hypothetical protein
MYKYVERYLALGMIYAGIALVILILSAAWHAIFH